MKRIYFCPACGATLNPNVKIILTARKGPKQGLVLFSPQPGNYQAIVADDLALTPGDLVEFACPVCQAALKSGFGAYHAEIGFRLSSGTTGRVHFSRKYGEHATYFVTDESVQSYGEHAMEGESMNFFGAARENLE